MILLLSKIKGWLKISWAFIKAHWQFFIGALVPVAIMILLRKKNSSKVLLEGIERKNNLIEIKRKSVQEEEDKRIKALEEYEVATKKIKEEYEKKNKSLSKKEEKIVKDIIKDADGDQELLTKLLKDRFNL